MPLGISLTANALLFYDYAERNSNAQQNGSDVFDVTDTATLTAEDPTATASVIPSIATTSPVTTTNPTRAKQNGLCGLQ